MKKIFTILSLAALSIGLLGSCKKEEPVAKTFTVTFDVQGKGTAPAAIKEVKEGSTITKPTDPTADGFTFGGWFKEAACTTEWKFDTDKVTSDITLYAKWSTVTFTVTFDVQGKGTAPAAQTVAEGSSVEKPADPTADGFAFGGWFKEAACTTEWKFDTDKVTADVTLYAKWTTKTYTVTFDVQGKGTAPAAVTVEEGSTIQMPNEPAYEGFAFVAWFKEAACTNVWNFATDKVTADVTLYAKWVANTGEILGTGTISDPYILFKAEHLNQIAEKAKTVEWSDYDTYYAADSTCFKLGTDIDFSNAEISPINVSVDKKIGQKIDFNGAGHTLKNFKISGKEKVALFPNIAGNIHDLKVEGAEVTFTGKKGAILVGQGGTGDNGLYTRIYNCYVKGKVTYTGDYASSDTEVSLGGIVGQQCHGEIRRCEADVELVCNGTNGEHYVGGISGSFGKESVTVSDCITRGNYHAGEGSNAYMFGGIVGCSQKNYETITNCISLATINCRDMAGGIIGLLNYNKAQETCYKDAKDSYITGCIYWGDAITVPTGSTPILESGLKVGAIVAWGSEGDNYANCWRSPALTGFTDDADHAKNEAFSGMPCITYNGKAATVKTASAAARVAGWDETIWDLSGDVPALKCLQ